MDQGWITRTRRTFDRALQSLPITQHERIWQLYLVRTPSSTSSNVWALFICPTSFTYSFGTAWYALLCLRQHWWQYGFEIEDSGDDKHDTWPDMPWAVQGLSVAPYLPDTSQKSLKSF